MNKRQKETKLSNLKKGGLMAYSIISSKTFGEFCRYNLVTFIDRFGKIGYIVEDAETIDEMGLPSIIRQGTERVQVLAGL